MLGCVNAAYPILCKEGTADHEANLHHHHARPRGRFFESKPQHCGRGREHYARELQQGRGYAHSLHRGGGHAGPAFPRGAGAWGHGLPARRAAPGHGDPSGI